MRNTFFFVVLSALFISTAWAQPRQLQPADATDDRPKIDVEKYVVATTLVPEEHRLGGVAEVYFKQLERKDYVVFDLDRRLRVSNASIAGKAVSFRQFDLDSTVEFDMKDQQFTSQPVLHVEYSGILNPEEGRRDPILARVSEDSAFLLYDGKWFPTNGLRKDKAVMLASVKVPSAWTVVSDLPAIPNESNTFGSNQPSFWGMIAAGDYKSRNVPTERGELVVASIKAPEDAVTPMAENAGKILGYYSTTFGPLPLSSFRIVEVEGANWNSQYSVGTLLLPSSQFRKDFDIASLARTLAHQWFPLKIPVKDPATDAWLEDGMAVFASLMYFQSSLSPADFQQHVDKALVKALGYEGNTSVRQAGSLEKDNPDYHSLVEYRGAYILRMLQWVIGEDKFKQLIAQYVQAFQNTPASTEAFTKLASQVAGEDLNYFFDQWLNSTGVPEFQEEYTVFRRAEGYKVMGQIKQDLDLFRMPLELQVQTDGEPEYKRVEVSGQASDFDVMVDRKPKAVVVDPRKKVLRMSNDIRVAVLINRGEEFANDNEYNRAVDEYQKAIDIAGRNSLAMFRMGEALFELGNLQLAANVFRDSLNGDLEPKWVEVWAYINLGKIYDIRGDRDRALNQYQKAVNTGDDAYSAQAEAKKYLTEPFRRTGKATIGE
jgi:tetratricopeptide (TPR) repeat protein